MRRILALLVGALALLPTVVFAQEATDPVETATSTARALADSTLSAAEALLEWLSGLIAALNTLPQTLDGLREAGDLAVITAIITDLAITVIATYSAFLLLRIARNTLRNRLRVRAEGAPLIQRVVMILALLAADIATIALAWLAGYGAVLVLAGPSGTIAVIQTLYLNAFVAVVSTRALVRTILAPSTPELRFTGMSDAAAQRITRFIRLEAFILGYGLLLLVPVLGAQISPRAADAVMVVISLVAILLSVIFVIRARKPVAAWIDTQLATQPGTLLSSITREWWIPVSLYGVSLAGRVLTQSGDAVISALLSGIQALLMTWVGILLAGGLTRYTAQGVRLSDGIRSRLPLLEKRLNRFVQPALTAIRTVVLLGIIAIVLDATDLTDIGGWIFGSGTALLGSAVSVLITLGIGLGLWLVFSSWVEYRLNPNYGSVATARETTLLSILRNAATIALIIIVLMIVLSELGINIAPLIASAGVLGLAIGFGAQKMVEDIITGIFIQFENAVNVGEVVTLGGVTGVVEKLTVRSVSLRDVNGIFHVIPFSAVSSVSNFSKDFAFHVEDMGIAYRENVDEAKQAMFDAFELLRADDEFGHFILEDLQWFGVNSMGDNAVILRARIKTIAGQQWGVGRAYKYYLKKVFDERDIEIPFPQRTLWFGVGKDGTAPPAPLPVAAPKPEGDQSV
ncbi:MAG: mechanosensitive ion channel domain-containing protein [Pseudomonadota bacterium]